MEKQKQQPQRLQSLDALRGFDMLFIMGGASLFVALATLFPNPFFQAIAGQMEHVEWNGLAHHDTIFPLFLFIAGISFPFSLEKQRGKGMTEGAIYKKIVRRGITLVFLGLVYNGLLSFEFDHLRCASVLARIGLGWMFAALLFVRFGWKAHAGITVLILVGYWLAMAFVPVPDAGGAGPFTLEGNWMFALFFYIIDVLGWRKWTLFFTVIGMNSITIYLAQRFIRFSYTSEAIFGGLAKLMPETAQPLVSAIAYIAVCWGFLYFLYRQRIFLKV